MFKRKKILNIYIIIDNGMAQPKAKTIHRTLNLLSKEKSRAARDNCQFLGFRSKQGPLVVTHLTMRCGNQIHDRLRNVLGQCDLNR